MRVAAFWASLLLACSSSAAAAGAGAAPGAAPGAAAAAAAASAEPSCEELRAMWRYSKRQSRAAEATNEIPTYRDPFSYNVWDPYLDRPRTAGYGGPAGPGGYGGYGEGYGAQARSRGAGGAPIYGRVVHKAPEGYRLRNGMPDRSRAAFEEVARLYGTVNRHPPSSRRVTGFRHGGGGDAGQVPQAGSFQHLKDLVRSERARELQEQRRLEEMAARAAALKEMTGGDRRRTERFLDEMRPYRNSKRDLDVDVDRARYSSNVADLVESLSGRSGREYMLR
ncbi:uncharacterized protein LOC105697905 [Orussus abietinus]|uniref:uncharacterized protein LOC105697905 n=1 Tax=Orussus abietinus TaxID=222816 RepID=UPI000C7161A9|nr:uncharacterized protein LOC105697905 [Orussus abietinus]